MNGLEKIVGWLDATLDVAAFDDVSNNGLQVDRVGETDAGCATVAFAVDASVASVRAAAAAGARLLVVHHGISWGGGVKRLTGGVFHVVRSALASNLAIYACHLPLDAHPALGNNAQLAKLLRLRKVRPAFSYHGHVIGCIGVLAKPERLGSVLPTSALSGLSGPLTLGVCSGGAGEFAPEAKRLGCDAYLTGEASWGDVVAAENVGMRMICAGHYETEVFGVRAVAVALRKAMNVRVVDLT